MWGTGVLPFDLVTTRGRSDDPSGPKDQADGHAPLESLVGALLDLADRLRRLPESRLRQVATEAHELAQTLAAPRTVPELSIFALGDQLTVLTKDLATSAALDDAALRRLGAAVKDLRSRV